MFNLKERLGGYTPGTPLITPEPVGHNGRFNRTAFTPEIQKAMINNHFGMPEEAPAAPNVIPQQPNQQVVNDSPVISTEKLARYERMETLMTQPHVLKAIGDAVLAHSQPGTPPTNNVVVPPTTPVGTPPIEPPQGPPAPQGALDPNDFVNNLWENLNDEQTTIVNTQNDPNAMNVIPPPVVPPVVPPVQTTPQVSQEQQQMLVMAQQAGINPQDFSRFMEGLSTQDFINLYTNNRQPSAPVAPVGPPQANLAEAPGLHTVPVRRSYVSPQANVNRFGV